MQELLGLLAAGERRLLVQHAAGSGKTETIGLLAWEALSQGLFSHVVAVVRPRRACSSSDVHKRLEDGQVFFALLQKFSDPSAEEKGEEDEEKEEGGGEVVGGERAQATGEATAGEASERILVIIDEAHRGVPEEGAHTRAVEARYGARHCQVFFTATPKADTLLSHGKLRADGSRVAFHCHSQREAVTARYVLNPLEFYHNCVPDLQVNGKRLAAMSDPVSIETFMEQLNNQRATKSVMEQRAKLVFDKMPEVYASSPLMTEKGHQIKVMVVLPTIQAVYDFGQLLRSGARGKRTALGKPFVIGTFFSLRAEKITGKQKSMVTQEEANNGVTPKDCDILVTCRKYVTGYDEWRVCAIFLATRVSQPEFLQQVLGRATRARPGEGKRRPLIFDLANNPDTIFASVMRFWDQTRHYPEPLGELKEMQKYVSSFPGVGDGSSQVSAQASLAAARRLPVSDRVLLRAALAVYWRVAARVSNRDTPMRFDWLRELLLALNLDLTPQLFGGSEALARAAAHDVTTGREPGCSKGGVARSVAAVRTVPAALKVLRSSLQLGRRKRPRRDLAETPTPQKKRLRTGGEGGADADARGEDARDAVKAACELATPERTAAKNVLPSAVIAGDAAQTPPRSVPLADELGTDTPAKKTVVASRDETALIHEGLAEAVADIVARFKKGLPAKGGNPDTPDRRESELERFDFGSAPLRRFNASLVKKFRLKLARGLARAYGEALRPWLVRQKDACERAFVERSFGNRVAAVETIQRVCMDFEEVTAGIAGGSVTGALRSGLRRKLTRKLQEQFGEPAAADSEEVVF